MAFARRAVDGDALLTVDGRVDMANADALKDALLEALEATSKALVVDLAGMEYISSAGLRALMIANRTAKGAGKQMGLAGPCELVQEIFTISRFNLVFSIFPSVREAFQALSPEALRALGE